MILAEKSPTSKTYTFKRDKLNGRVWHKYLIHDLRHGDRTKHLIASAMAWSIDNIEPNNWLVHVMDYDSCAIFYLADDQDAMLFELGQTLHPGDKRGKKVWG